MTSRDTRRRFEQWANNPECQANATSAILGISMVDVAKREGLEPSMGQSPFALQRGQRFERQLFHDDARVLRAEIEKASVLPAGSKGFVDFRLRQVGGSCRTLDEARERTRELFDVLADSGVNSKTPSLVAGATICVPGRAMLPEAILVLDALVIRANEKLPELVVGEIKTYPDRGGYTDRAELAGARAQAGVYVHGLIEVLRQDSLADRISVATTGFLVLTKPGSIGLRCAPAKISGIRQPVQRAASTSCVCSLHKWRQKVHHRRIQSPRSPPHRFTTRRPAFGFADRASGCFKRALAAGKPGVLGDDAARLLGTMNLDRVQQILQGAQPKTHAERELVALAGARGVR